MPKPSTDEDNYGSHDDYDGDDCNFDDNDDKELVSRVIFVFLLVLDFCIRLSEKKRVPVGVTLKRSRCAFLLEVRVFYIKLLNEKRSSCRSKKKKQVCILLVRGFCIGLSAVAALAALCMGLKSDSLMQVNHRPRHCHHHPTNKCNK